MPTDHLTEAATAHHDAKAAQRAMRAAASRRTAAVHAAYAAGIGVAELATALDVHRTRIYAMLNQGERHD